MVRGAGTAKPGHGGSGACCSASRVCVCASSPTGSQVGTRKRFFTIMFVCSPVPELPFPSIGDHPQTATIVAYPEPPPALLAAREALLRVFHAVPPPVLPALCGGASWWDAVLAANRALLLQLLPLLPEGASGGWSGAPKASVVIICVGPLCAPLPALLRRAGVRAPIAFIAGAPFTCAESYRELPAAPRRGWLEGVLCADACCKSHAPHRTRPKPRATS